MSKFSTLHQKAEGNQEKNDMDLDDLESRLTPSEDVADSEEDEEDMADSEEAEAHLDAMEAAHRFSENARTDTQDSAETKSAKTTQAQPAGLHFQQNAEVKPPESEQLGSKPSGPDPFSALLMAPFSISARLAQGAQQRLRTWRGQRAAAAVTKDLWELAHHTHEIRARTEEIARISHFDQMQQEINSEPDPLRREALERFLNDEVNRWRQGAGRQTVADLEQAMDRVEKLSRSVIEKARRHPEHIDLNHVHQTIQQELDQVNDAMQPLQRLKAESLSDLRERMRKIERMMRQIIDVINRLLQRLGLGGKPSSPAPSPAP